MDNILIYLSTTVLQNPSSPAYEIKLNYFLICTLKLIKEFTKEKKNCSKCRSTIQQLIFNRDGKKCLHHFTGLVSLHVHFCCDLAFEIFNEKNFHLLQILLISQKFIFCRQWLLYLFFF